MWLALPLPWLAAWRLPPRRVNSAALRVPYGSRLQAIGASARRSPRRPGVAALAWLAWFLLCAAAARPQQLGEAVAPPQSARDLVLALDLSGSMSEPDMELGGQVVDRLTAAKAVLADFVERRTGDRIGLLVFGQRAYALTPLTLDRDSVRDQLRDSVAGLAGRETAIGDTIALAVKRLREQPKGQRVLILLTDGVNTAGLLDPLKAAELAKAENVRVHTIAFGGAGGAFSLFGLSVPMPGGDDQIDEATLQKIADETGGRAFRARDVEQLAEIYGTLDRIEPVEQPGERVRPRVERYWWPLGAALGVSLLAFLLPRRPR
ncbi:MAG TPA: VWA domain-containing protein [Pseudoxanthomonas sp.]|nr:VWA domain-containing protein [Pseudoxanthomonas sp.]